MNKDIRDIKLQTLVTTHDAMKLKKVAISQNRSISNLLYKLILEAINEDHKR